MVPAAIGIAPVASAAVSIVLTPIVAVRVPPISLQASFLYELRALLHQTIASEYIIVYLS